MDTLRLELAHPLRAFELAVALEVGSEPLALVGPSGAGKTTLLRAIAGLLRPAHGVIAVGDEVWLDTARAVDLSPERRSVGLVFQDYALFPHLSVEQNVAFGARQDTRVAELLDAFGLGSLARVRPGELSGGQRQRVALARALAREPAVLLLDEPFAALDAQTRDAVRADLRRHLEAARVPALVVTHDYADAVALADRIGVVVSGRVVQVGSPAELVAEPADAFVARFTGANVLVGRARPSGGLTEVTLDDGTRLRSTDDRSGPVALVIHPWEVALAQAAPADSTQNHVHASVHSVVPVGNRVRVRVGPLTAEVTADSARRMGLRPGVPVVASFKATGARLVPLG